MAAMCESNVIYDACEEEKVIKVLEMCQRLGYKSVVLNSIWKDRTPTVQHDKKKQKDKQNKTKGNKSLPAEITPASKLKDLKNRMNHVNKDFNIYSRFTLILEDALQSRMLQKHDAIHQYDILAVKPTNEKMYDLACKNLDIDIITFDLNEKLPFYLKRSKTRMAVARGVHFEICYVPMLLSRDARRCTVSGGQMLVEYTGGRNIILCGCCTGEMDVRGPYDVINLGTLFNLNLEQCRHTVTRNCQQMILHAEMRKSALGVVKMEPRSEVKDLWILEHSQADQEIEDQTESSPSDEEAPLRKKQKLSEIDQETG